MKKPKIATLILSKKTIISFIVSFSILCVLLREADISAVVEAISNASLPLLLMAFVLHYSSFLVRGIRWKTLLKASGIDINISDTTRMVFLSWFVNSIVPAKLGDVYRSYLLKKQNDSPISASLGTLVVERLFDIAILLLLLSTSGLKIFKNNMPSEISQSIEMGYFLLIMVFFGMIFVWIFKEQLLEIVPEKFHFHFRNMHTGIYNSLSDRKIVFRVIVLTSLTWTLEASRFMLVTQSLGLNLSLEIIIFVVLAACLLTAIPLTPAGLGAVEVAIVFILGIFGTDVATGTSVALLDRLISYWSILVTGSIAYILNEMNNA